MGLAAKRLVFLFLCAIIVIGSAVFISRVFSYNDTVTHPFLAEQSAKLFNQNFGNKLTNQQIAWIKQGAVEEDTPLRWMNHFFDPKTGLGLWRFASAKDWSESSIEQMLYPKGNQTFQKAVSAYAKGDEKEAFIALGHIIHLIEDMTVPAHTRMDAHPEGDPYENWAKENGNKTFDNLNIQKFNYLREFFDSLAEYSSENFLSKDSTDDNELKNKEHFFKKISEDEWIECIRGSAENYDFCLIKYKENKFGIPEYLFDWPVHSDYYSLLAPKAVAYGTGVIDLFLRIAEAEKQKNQERNWFEKLTAGLGILDIETEPTAAVMVTVPDAASEPEISPESADNTGDTFGYPIAEESSEPGPAIGLISPISPRESTIGPISQISQPSPLPAPSPSPTLGVGSQQFVVSLPYPGFGGGGSGVGASEPTPGVNEEPEPKTEPEPLTPPADVTAPDIALTVSECENSLSSESCLLITPPIGGLNIHWSSLAEDLDYFEITINGETNITTSTSTTVVELADNSSNTFSVRAKDTSDNWSDPQTTSVIISSIPVVINEVAWPGTSNQTSQDEWIELYNRTPYSIDLDGWVLYSETDLKPWINLNGSIPAQDYYLIERTDDNTVSDVPANLTVSFGNGLDNRGEVLVLSHASTTIDQTVLCVGGRYQWPPCYDYSYRSMERADPDVAGTNASNWGINNTLIKNGKDAKDDVIYGTPKARNSVNYLIDNGRSNISSDITLKKSRSPYLVNNQIQILQDNAVLFIEPGVVIKFYNDAGLSFTGNSKIIAQGSASEPILFTGFDDDEYAGDTNNNATSTIPVPGSWFGIKVETSNNDSVFENTIFRYGGKFYSGWGIAIDLGRSNLTVQNSAVNIKDSIFEYSKIHGLKIINSNSTVSGNIFRNNNNENDPAGYNASLVVLGGNPNIQNNTFTRNARGIYLSNAGATIDSNNFQSNKGEAIYSFGLVSNFSGNSGSDNNINTITINGNLTQENSTSTLRVNSLPYYLWGYETPAVVASSTLIIEPGTILKSSRITYGNPLVIYGNLIISGSSPNDIVFTSFYDDSVGNDADNDGGASAGNRGDWTGVVMKPGSYSEISGATFKYAITALTYQNSPINLSKVKFISNITAVSADFDSIVQTAESLEFIDNTATTTPADLF